MFQLNLPSPIKFPPKPAQTGPNLRLYPVRPFNWPNDPVFNPQSEPLISLKQTVENWIIWQYIIVWKPYPLPHVRLTSLHLLQRTSNPNLPPQHSPVAAPPQTSPKLIPQNPHGLLFPNPWLTSPESLYTCSNYRSKFRSPNPKITKLPNRQMSMKV